jgi:aspartate/methionine/tyrosine aminotransferase
VDRPFWLTKLLVKSRLARWLPSVNRSTSGAGPYLHYYSDRVLAAPVAGLRSGAELLERQAPDAIDLGTGNPRFDFVTSMTTKLPADRRGWPPAAGLVELREAVSSRLRVDHNVQVNATDEILITPGASGALAIVLDSFLNPGESVAVYEPMSPLFHLALAARRARVRPIRTWMENGRLRFHMHHLSAALRHSRLLLLNQPHNPTGGVLPAEDIEQIAWWAARRDALIVSDEVFEQFHYEGDCPSVAANAQAKDRTLTIGSVSKSFALASHRIGWVSGNRHLIRACLLAAVAQNPFVPTLCQQIALSALCAPADRLLTIRREFQSRRQYVFERLSSMGLRPDWPVGGFFFWIPVGAPFSSGREFVARLWQSKHVTVWPGDLFGSAGSKYIRLSYTAEEGRLREGLARIADFIRDAEATAHKMQAA